MRLKALKIVSCLLAVLMAVLPAGCGNETAYLGEEGLPLSCDVVVIGSGPAALTAAIEAARSGASVVVLDQGRDAGQWLLESPAVAASAEEQVGAGAPEEPSLESDDEETVVGLTSAELYQALAGRGGDWGKRKHFELLAKHAYADLLWLAAETGATLRQLWPGHFRLDNLVPGQAYQRLLDAVRREGVRFMDMAVADEVLFSEAGFITGVRFSVEEAAMRIIHTRAVILADGGYLHDRELMQEIAPAVEAAAWRSGGEAGGLRMAIRMGLDLVQLDHYAYYPSLEENGQWVKAYFPQSAMLVLEEQIIPLHGKSIADLGRLLLDSNSRSGHLLVAESHMGREEREQLKWPSYSGIDNFMNAYALDFPLLSKWFERPDGNFKGTTVKAVAEYCLGGVAVGDDGSILIGGEPAAGFYAAGEIAGGLHGRELMPGAALSEAVVWGRLVGREAAAFAQR